MQPIWITQKWSTWASNLQSKAFNPKPDLLLECCNTLINSTTALKTYSDPTSGHAHLLSRQPAHLQTKYQLPVIEGELGLAAYMFTNEKKKNLVFLTGFLQNVYLNSCVLWDWEDFLLLHSFSWWFKCAKPVFDRWVRKYHRKWWLWVRNGQHRGKEENLDTMVWDSKKSHVVNHNNNQKK